MGELSSSELDPCLFEATELSHGWFFREKDDSSDGDNWLPVKQVPSTVHQDLMDNQKIEHPFVGLNATKAEWVGTKSWTYRTHFTAPDVPAGAVAVLAFDGLDTFATVSLDGTVILESDNMFVPHRVDVTHQLGRRTVHTLDISFDSAILKAREIQRRHPDHKAIAWNGEPARVFARKAQYHWGWDWGPMLTCAGIWKPIRLEVYSCRISDVRISTSMDGEVAEFDVVATVEGYYQRNNLQVKVAVRLADNNQIVTSGQDRVDSRGENRTSLTIDPVQLWWPNGYGKQNLYKIEVNLLQDGVVVHSITKRIGFRTISLIQQPDKHGKSFFFRINGVDIFCGGSCWIPADSLLTTVTKDRYRAWLGLMVPANQKMIRVWGGGIYESDDFYDACDELGILVWQDFMFACGNYPVWPEMLKSVEAEAIANVRRIRHHPSLAVLVGNNEDYQVRESANLDYDSWGGYSSLGYNALGYRWGSDRDKWLKTNFPARYLYEELLPRIVMEEVPGIPYHPGSPWGDGKITTDPKVGDLHQWNVWHGSQEKYQTYDSLGGRFNSEFGMQAFPHMDTVKTFVQNEDDLYPQSHVMDFHNKAAGHERRIATYLLENVRTTTARLEDYIYLTQLIQCEALMFAYRGWRKQWGDDRQCGGALVWQFNDCWPGTSWSIVDYYLRRKPAYYAIARALAPIAVGVRRKHHDWSVSHAREPKTQAWELWAVSSKLEDVTVDVELRFISVKTGKDIKHSFFKTGIRLAANGTTEISSGYIDNTEEEPHVLAARLWAGAELVARDTDWPQPFKYLGFAERKLKVSIRDNGSEIRVTAERPVKCLVFEERTGYRLSDSAIDLVPGDEQVISSVTYEYK
ncbi:hypothetical protein DV735_g3268, partial [Chaetothyriales sp. CBS 134920]